MRLYTLSKRHFVLVFVVFFICFGITVFIGIAGKKKKMLFYTGPFQLKSPPLSTYNQQLWLTCLIQLIQVDGMDFHKEFDMSVEIKGIMQDASVMHIHDNVYNRSRLLHCGAICEEIIVVHLGYLNYTQYQINVNFEKLQTRKYEIKEVHFTCLFAHSLRKFSMRDWGIEQKWMSVLLPLLLLYNDPFFPLSFLMNSWFPGMLDDLFQAVFLCALLLFWLCVYHGFRVQGERKCLTFYLPKLFIVGLLWLSAVTLGIWQTVNELHDPTYQFKVDTGNFQVSTDYIF
ncbi:UNVERIFIED_CONTAM: hypothetical protein FKN15_017628 [Acipenser sinensis]